MAEFSFDASALTETLEAAGYDVDPPGGDAGVVTARLEGSNGVAVVVIDRGGRLKYTLTRDTAPERSRSATVAGQRCQLVDTTTRTTVALFTLTGDSDLKAVLADLERAAAH